MALEERRWFPVATAQLASTAFGRIVPGGGATAAAFEVSLLRRAGVAVGRASAALASTSALQYAALLALPILALPAVIGGAPADRSLVLAAVLGAVVLVLILIAGTLAFAYDKPLLAAGRAVQWVANRTIRRRRPVEDLPQKLLVERTFVRTTLGRHWPSALVTAVAVPSFDYLALLSALRALGAAPQPSLVLLAYVSAALLTLVPLTPGGFGFVEAGLVGGLALAGVSGEVAVTATLAYRLVAFWLPIPAGGVAYVLFRRRYGDPSARVSVPAGSGDSP
jgi:uncharacterized protein (TIRG00374 family)